MRYLMKRNLLASLALAGLLAAPLSLMAAGPYLGIAAEAKEADQPGVTLRAVSPDGPAWKAGLRKNDRIVKAGDKVVKTFADLQTVLAGLKPGDKLAIHVVRDGKEQTITVTLGEMPEHLGIVTHPAPKTHAYLGIHSQVLTAELKEIMGVQADNGVLVAQVAPGSPAAKAGLQEEDVITHVGSAAVTSPEELRDAVRKVGVGKEVMLKVVRGKKEMELKVTLQEAPAGTDLPEGLSGLPGDFVHGKMPSFFKDMAKVPALEKKVQELENRVKELEKKLTR